MKMQEETAIAITYTSMMAISMYASKNLFGFTYDNPEIVKVLLFTQMAMLVYAIHSYRKNRKGFDGRKCRIYPGIVIYGILILLTAAIHIKEAAYREYGDMMFQVLLTNAIVGISEELVYRGTIARLMLARKGRIYAVIGSSLLFSLLHAVNLLGGLHPSAMTVQLVNTFVYGILASTSMIASGTMIPFMFFHAIWDAVMSSPIFVSNHIQLIAAVMVSEAVIATVQLLLMIGSGRCIRKTPPDGISEDAA